MNQSPIKENTWTDHTKDPDFGDIAHLPDHNRLCNSKIGTDKAFFDPPTTSEDDPSKQWLTTHGWQWHSSGTIEEGPIVG